MEDNLALCGGSLNLMEMVQPKGGTFSGNYIYNGIFKGDSAPIGESEAIYTVTNKGCTLRKSILIKNEPAQYFDFVPDFSSISEGGKVHFVPENATMMSYTWYFGDGAWSKETSPYHYYYHDNAKFDIKLEVKNTLGCILSTQKDTLITVGSDAKGRYVAAYGKKNYYDTLTAITEEEISDMEAITECKASDIVIYPNPTRNGVLNFNYIECVEQVTVYDLKMQKIGISAPNSGTIAVSGVATGIYLVALKLTDGSIKVSKVLIIN
jgi:hypothetical protein